jgi:hypothetical protein
MRADPRVSLDVLDADGWYTHVGIWHGWGALKDNSQIG